MVGTSVPANTIDGCKSGGSDPDHARVQGAQVGILPVRRTGRYRKIGFVVRKLEHLAQIKLGVVAQACTGVCGGMFALGDAEFTAVEPIRLLTRSVGHAHKKPALIVFLGQRDQPGRGLGFGCTWSGKWHQAISPAVGSGHHRIRCFLFQKGCCAPDRPWPWVPIF
jgi:hypothetical protein